jgi:hypothetical protein
MMSLWINVPLRLTGVLIQNKFSQRFGTVSSGDAARQEQVTD